VLKCRREPDAVMGEIVLGKGKSFLFILHIACAFATLPAASAASS
jgi:hypothetical protein